MRLLLLLAFGAPIFAQDCSNLSVTPLDPVHINGGAGTGTVNVTLPVACSWIYARNVDWITFFEGPAGGRGSGPGSFKWNATPNTLPLQRTATITVIGAAATATVTIVQDPPPGCNLALTPPSANFGFGSGFGSFQVQSACQWSASSGSSWIGVPAGTGGSTSGSVTYTVVTNVCESSRTGTVVVQGSPVAPSTKATFQVLQEGVPVGISLSSQGITVPPAASDGRLVITAPTGCGWSARVNVSWLHITSGSSGTGEGPLTYHVDANTGGSRSGIIQVGSQAFTVVQEAPPAAAVQLNAAVNSASYAAAPAAVSPGEIVALYGTNLGPAGGAKAQLSADGKSLTKSLAGTAVLFDGVPAALTYASAGQVNAVVPYSAADQTSVQVQYQGVSSNTLKLPVQSATPGIFTLDASGLGAGAILNQDYNVNGALNPAARGSIVMIYATGGGVTSPASEDGALTTTEFSKLPRLVEKRLSVSFGGIPSTEVTYSGGAPTAVAGLTQINARIPQGVTPGSFVPVVIQIGDWQSQPGVTIAVK